MEVYIVMYENLEDGQWDVAAVFSTKRKAEEFLESHGFERDSSGPWIDWYHDRVECKFWIAPFFVDVASRVHLPWDFPKGAK